MTPRLESLRAAAWMLRFAALNLSRHTRRTAIAVVTVATGFCALALFSGYTANAYQGMRNQAIFAEMLGHITLAKPGLREQGVLDPQKWLLKPQDIDAARAAVLRAAPGARVYPRLAFNGLISNGRVSTVFIAEALAPQDMRALRGPMADASGALEDDHAHGISVSRTLASLLEAKHDGELSLLSSTVNGQTNVIEAVLRDTYDTGNISTNDKSLFVPLQMARDLLDADGRADRLTVVLEDLWQVDETLPRIEAEMRRAGLPLAARSWVDDASAYRQVRAMFDLIFAFMFCILLFICAMALTNVVGMNVIERSREIGALRAQGMRQATVIRLLSTEALIIVAFGCLAGLVLSLLIGQGINAAGLGFTPPNSTDRVPLTIGVDALRLCLVTLFLAASGTLAAWWTARRAAHRPIIDALGHV